MPATTNTTSATTRFSTDNVPLRDRVEVTREVLGRAYLRMDLEPLGEAPFRANFEQQSWSLASLISAFLAVLIAC